MAMASSGASCLAMAALLLAACASSTAATSYTVGDASGWTTGVDYTSWAGSKSFKVGDSLLFKYASGAHNVVEVSAAGYLACTAANALGSDSSGSTTVALKAGRKHYFICSIPGHCAAGMKLEVDVSGSSSSGGGGGGGVGTTPSSPTPTTPSPSTPTPTTPYPSNPRPTTPYPSNPTPTTPYTTPTSPACTGGAGATPVTPVMPGTTPFMSYNGAGGGLGPLALATIGVVCFVVFVQLGLL